MKSGDKVPVQIGPHTIAQATVKEVNTKEGTATLVVPATLVVMGVRTELTDLPQTEPGTETVITGVDKPESSAPVGVEHVESTPVGEQSANSVEAHPVVPVADGGISGENTVRDISSSDTVSTSVEPSAEGAPSGPETPPAGS